MTCEIGVRMTRYGHVRGAVAGLLAVVLAGSLLPAGAAVAAPPGPYQPALAGIPSSMRNGDAEYQIRQAREAFPNGVGEQLGEQRLAALSAHAEGTFLDGYRVVSRAQGLAAFKDAQHFIAWAAPRVEAQPSATSTALLAAATASRLVAANAVEDLRATLVPAILARPDGAAAQRDLRDAVAALGRGDDALRRGSPEPATVQHRTAWERAFGALASLGVSYEGDSDGDGLADLAEVAAGASPLVLDTDGDGLPDRYEIERLLGLLSPSLADTDGDGTGDAAGDLDGDGLSELVEHRLGTSPTEPDSDFDEVGDKEEGLAGTDPLRADTDSDGLDDSIEPPLGLDPTRADTDGDGVPDGQELVQTDAPAPDGVLVRLSGTGDLLGSFSASRYEEPVPALAGQVGRAYDFVLDGDDGAVLETARLTLPYDTSVVTPDADLRVLYLDETAGVWRLAGPDQRVDTARGTVTLEVDHFSTYAVFDIRNWQQTWAAVPDSCRTRTDNGGAVSYLDLALILDSSGSMQTNDPQGLRRSASKNFVDALLSEDRAAVVDFDSDAQLLQGLTSDKAVVKAAIDRIDASGGTNIGAGVRIGTDVLIAADGTRDRLAILLTDGEGAYDQSLTERARLAKIPIFTIALGSSVDEPLLRSIATGTGGQYYQVATAADLPEVFRRVEQDSGTGPDAATDTDGDGLTDCVETGGTRGPDGALEVTDPNNPDTDGDGATDGEEVGDRVDYADLSTRFGDSLLRAHRDAGVTSYIMSSSPTRADTDGDGLSDLAEQERLTNPRNTDTDGDGVRDGREVDEEGTDPRSGNTDGDAYSDGFELREADRRDLDPLVHNTRISKLSYAVSFAKGVTCGTFCFDDNIAWLSGNLIAGFLGFGDAVDIVKSVISAEWVNAGLNVLALIPIVGDGGKVAAKVTKFVNRVPRRFNDVTRTVATWNRLPDRVKTTALRALLPLRYGRLRDASFGDDVIRRLASGQRTDLRVLADTASSSLRRPAGNIGFRSTGKSGERAVRTQLGLSTSTRVYTSRTPLRRSRIHDGTEVLSDGKLRNHEVKTGRTDRRDDLEQCKKDGQIKRATNNEISDIVWHFVGNSRYNTMGPSRELLDGLTREGLGIALHVPS